MPRTDTERTRIRSTGGYIKKEKEECKENKLEVTIKGGEKERLYEIIGEYVCNKKGEKL